ncbi:hypothetical protein [Halomonas halocynthiae]|uniref:hypothetical protein n=1 Tax=Halomonas halocynthiae TaxID=176290 RepID=UPI000423A742
MSYVAKLVPILLSHQSHTANQLSEILHVRRTLAVHRTPTFPSKASLPLMYSGSLLHRMVLGLTTLFGQLGEKAHNALCRQGEVGINNQAFLIVVVKGIEQLRLSTVSQLSGHEAH